MRFYTASKLGSKRSWTKEGFLVCLDVPIARTGEMLYADTELPGMEASRDGLIRVQRDATEVFKPESLASFIGKPTTNGHPPEMVSPANYRRFSCGSAQNVRQGQGDQADLVIADLIWCDPAAIKAIEDGKVEISNGYDAEYDFIAPGLYRQVNIIGNHIALVEEARCGERCSIGDSAAALQATANAEAVVSSDLKVVQLPDDARAQSDAPIAPTKDSAPSCGCGGGHHHHDQKPARARKRTKDMAATRNKLKGSMLDRLRRTFQAKDEAGFEEAMSAVEEAAEATEEDQAKAEFAQMIGAAVSEAIAPITARLDDVDAFITDRKSKDEAEAEAEETRKKAEAEADAARKKEAEGKSGDTKDGTEDLLAFLRSRMMSDVDIEAAMAMLKKDDAEPPVAATDDAGVNGSTGSGVPAADPDDDGSTRNVGAADSASLLAEFRDTVAKAEILAPGVKLPVFDAKAKAKSTEDSICALRRRALRSAFDSAGKVHVAPFVTNAAPDFSKMTCDAIKHVFAGASELAKRANAPTIHVGDSAHVTHAAGVRDTIAGMNLKAKDLWKGQR